jgi:Carboxypeptidase regulatory-like domain
MSIARSFLLFVALGLRAQSTYTVAGTVVQHGTNQPLEHARVTLRATEPPNGRAASVLTEKDGRFKITDVPPGKYRLSAQWHGNSQLLQEDEQYSTAIVTGPSLDTEHIVFPFHTPGTIAVKVTGDEGEAVRGANVVLFRKGVFGGRVRFGMRAQNATNSSGEYRFTNLPPDTYFAVAVAHPWYAQPPPRTEPVSEQQRAIRSELNMAYPATYYVDSPEAAGATPILITEGSRSEAHIALHAVPALQVEMHEPEPEKNKQGMIVRSAFPMLFQEGPGGILFMMEPGMMGFGGPRSAASLSPGRYVIVMQQFNPMQDNPRSAAGGSATLDLHSDTSIDLNQLSHIDISGTTSVNGLEHGAPLTVTLQNLANRQFESGVAGADGVFHIQRSMYGVLFPGLYEVHLTNNPDFYIQSITAKGATIHNGILEVRDGARVELSIVAAKGAMKVNGVALQDGKPFAGAMVLLIPHDRSQGAPILRDQSDSDGTFTLAGAQPGKYSAIAVDDGHNLVYEDPGVIKTYLAHGLAIELLAAKDTRLEVPVQRRAQ